MPQTTDELFVSWANAAIAQYPLRRPKLYFLGHSDNVTFRVEEPGRASYLLRLHRPALKYWTGIRQLPEVIASELVWLEALAGEEEFAVQRPIHTREGKLVARVAVDGEDELPGTLLTWLEGQHFSPAAPDAELQAERFGGLVARMHNFSARWLPPAGFIRPTYDLDHFRRVFARLLRGADLDVFSEDIYIELHATRQAILKEIEDLPVNPELWGMIHADLHVGNFLVQDDHVIPIDFSFCGFGHYLFDLSVCLAGGLKPALRPVFLRGYRAVRSLPDDDLRVVSAYALAGRLSYYAYQVDNPAERAWLQRRIPEIVQNECARFLQGQSIWFDL